MKHKLDFDVFSISGIIFTIVGLPFVIIGAWLFMNPAWVELHGDGDTWLLAPAFLFCGSLCFIIGMILIATWIRRLKRRNRALSNGVYVYGRLEFVQMDWSKRINGWPASYMVVAAEIGGKTSRFEGPRKHYRTVFPEPGTPVRVYIDQESGSYAITDKDGNLF